MSFRPAPAPKRTRHSWERDDRRSLYINLGFVAAIVLGVLFLVAAAAASYWDDHFAPVATVNGKTLTKDDLRGRVLVDTWRLQRISANVQAALGSGRISQEQADAQYEQLQAQSQQLPASSLDSLIDGTLQSELAEKEGVAVTDADIDAQLLAEATAPELRHVWVIATTASYTSGDSTATIAKATDDAKQAIEKAKRDIEGGANWEEIAKAVSSDTTREKGGDLGWVSRDVAEDDFLAALFSVSTGEVTEVVPDGDRTFRIGRVTEISDSTVDPNYQQAIRDAKVPLEAYRLTVRHELVRKALEAQITKNALETPSEQRRVAQIKIEGTPGTDTAEEAKSSHILFAPGGDPDAARSLSSGDPAWALAEESANTAYEKLKADPTQFATLAIELSDDKGSGANGGDLPWFKQGDVDEAFGKALFAPGLTKGQILAPVRSQFGWHIIRYEDRRPAPGDRAAALRTKATAAGADFAALARENSDGAEAATGGELGWIARSQIDKVLEDAIFATEVGSVSEVVEGTDGWYIFLVEEKATRLPEGDQAETIRTSVFSTWYEQQKDAAEITQQSLPDDL